MSSTDAPAKARETVYVAIELSKKTWMLGIAHPDRDRPSIHRVCGGNIVELVSRLRLAARNNRRILVPRITVDWDTSQADDFRTRGVSWTIKRTSLERGRATRSDRKSLV